MLIDTLRADRLGTYGYERPTSPSIDALAESSVVFERAHSPAPWTLPSVVSMMLSKPVCEHGVTSERRAVGDSARPLALRLSEAGYETAAFYVNPYAGRLSGLDLGFSTSSLEPDQIDGTRVASWLSERPLEKPFFLYLHNTEPHDPVKAEARHLRMMGDRVDSADRRELTRLVRHYRHLTRYDSDQRQPLGSTDNTVEQREAMRALDALEAAFSKLYDAQVRAADERVAGIVSALVEAGVWDETLFVLLSDHGEELGEHGGWQHDQSVYEELVHVPLMVRLPGAHGVGRRVAERVTLLDVLPTVMELVGRPDLGGESRGSSLVPLIRGTVEGADSEMRVTSERINVKKYFRPWVETRGDRNLVIVDDAWKGIYNADVPSLELYDLATDPRERLDRSAEERRRSRAMVELAREFDTACRERSSTPQASDEAKTEELEALRSLGYIN